MWSFRAANPQSARFSFGKRVAATKGAGWSPARHSGACHHAWMWRLPAMHDELAKPQSLIVSMSTSSITMPIRHLDFM